MKAAGHTIIVSEHRLFYLYGLADRFLIMEDGQICEELTGEKWQNYLLSKCTTEGFAR